MFSHILLINRLIVSTFHTKYWFLALFSSFLWHPVCCQIQPSIRWKQTDGLSLPSVTVRGKLLPSTVIPHLQKQYFSHNSWCFTVSGLYEALLKH